MKHFEEKIGQLAVINFLETTQGGDSLNMLMKHPVGPSIWLENSYRQKPAKGITSKRSLARAWAKFTKNSVFSNLEGKVASKVFLKNKILIHSTMQYLTGIRILAFQNW